MVSKLLVKISSWNLRKKTNTNFFVQFRITLQSMTSQYNEKNDPHGAVKFLAVEENRIEYESLYFS